MCRWELEEIHQEFRVVLHVRHGHAIDPTEILQYLRNAKLTVECNFLRHEANPPPWNPRRGTPRRMPKDMNFS